MTPREHSPQNPLTQKYWSKNQGASIGLVLAFYMYVMDIWLSVLVGFLSVGAGTVSESFACIWGIFSSMGYDVQP